MIPKCWQTLVNLNENVVIYLRAVVVFHGLKLFTEEISKEKINGKHHVVC